MKHINAISVQDLSDYINENVRDGVVNGESLLYKATEWSSSPFFGNLFHFNNERTPQSTFLTPPQCAMVATTLNKRIQVSVTNKLVSMMRRYDNQDIETGMLMTSDQFVTYINTEFNMKLEGFDVELLIQKFYNVAGFGDVRHDTHSVGGNHNLIYNHELTRTQVLILAGSVSLEVQSFIINKLNLLELMWDRDNVYQEQLVEAIRKMKIYQETKVPPHNGVRIEEFDVSTGEMKFYFRPNIYINTVFQNDTSRLEIIAI